MTDRRVRPTTATVMMPRDTNPSGKIFGGEILSHIDQAAASVAGAACAQHVRRVVTVAMDKVIFKQPVHVGDVLECHASIGKMGTTSIAVHVEVEVSRNGVKIPVTAADAVYVAVNGRGKPIPVCSGGEHTDGSGLKRRRKNDDASALPPPGKCPTTATVMMPRDLNSMGSIFAGVILSHIDLAGAIAARAVCSDRRRRVVTVAMDKVVFKRPVLVGDVLQCYADVVRVGKTSIATHIEVVANRHGKLIPVTVADAVYVAVNKKGRPVPVLSRNARRKAGLAATSNAPNGLGKSASESLSQGTASGTTPDAGNCRCA